MGEKKSKKEGEKKKNNNSDGGKKDDSVLTVVLKFDMHCEGCASKIKKCIRGFEGVESVKGGNGDSNKMTVIGKVDPVKLREMVEQKVKKKVELVSPLPKKGNDHEGEKTTGEKAEKKTDEKKTKELPLATTLMKVDLHCQGCIQKIRKTVTKTKGYQEMSIDDQKNLVTVKGTMDMNALAESLKERLKKPVEIVPPKKDGGEKKEKSGGGGGSEMGNAAGGSQAGENRVQYIPYVYPNLPQMHGYGSGYPVEIFSDENPNACSVM